MTNPSVPPPGSSSSGDTVSAREGMELEARSLTKLALQRFLHHKLAMFSLLMLLVIALAALFAGPIVEAAPGDPFDRDLINRNHPPSAEFWFGTDHLGRDYFSRTLLGTRTSMRAAMVVAVVGTAIGTLLGLLAGYLGGWLDNTLMRLVDLVIAVPFLAALLVLTVFLGVRDPLGVGLILSAFLWTTIARVIRGNVLSLREKEFVEAAKASGASDLRVMFRHVLPNTVGPIVVYATFVIALAIQIEATLSFLGFGIELPFPALGKMIEDGRGRMVSDWWLVLMPGLMIVLICLFVNFIGDGLRDALDPTQRKKS